MKCVKKYDKIKVELRSRANCDFNSRVVLYAGYTHPK